MKKPSQNLQRLKEALSRIDAANAEDPNRLMYQDEKLPKELAHAQRRSEWLSCLAPDASELVCIAARAMHVKRWTIPRSSYPSGRVGYHKWRGALAQFHAKTTAEILLKVGYSQAESNTVAGLIQHKGAGSDADRQLLEDVACLTFFEFDLVAFARSQEREKMLDILRRTWRKMSPKAQAIARSDSIPGDARQLIDAALGSS